MASDWDESLWQRFETGKSDTWQYAEFGRRRGNWKQFRRAIFCRLMHDDSKQLYLPGMRPDMIIVTNLGQDQPIDWLLKAAGASEYVTANGLIAGYHERGSDELANRALKDFGHEQLPFQCFTPNAARYDMMLVGHFFLEAFKEDISAPVLSVGSYASSVRRRLIDIAGSILSHSGETILKVSRACMARFRRSDLFERCRSAPVIG